MKIYYIVICDKETRFETIENKGYTSIDKARTYIESHFYGAKKRENRLIWEDDYNYIAVRAMEIE